MTDGPDYQRLMDLIRERIVSGEYPVGGQIPSTRQWQEEGWSRDVIRAAITRLQSDGILRGHAGKGVYVLATPEDVAGERGDIKTLAEDMAGLKQEHADLRERIGRMEASLATLTPKSRGGKREQAKVAASGERR